MNFPEFLPVSSKNNIFTFREATVSDDILNLALAAMQGLKADGTPYSDYSQSQVTQAFADRCGVVALCNKEDKPVAFSVYNKNGEYVHLTLLFTLPEGAGFGLVSEIIKSVVNVQEKVKVSTFAFPWLIGVCKNLGMKEEENNTYYT